MPYTSSLVSFQDRYIANEPYVSWNQYVQVSPVLKLHNYKNRLESPRLSSLSFTHILQTDFVKEPGKTNAIVEIDITSALAVPLSSDFPKMWVKVRSFKRGMKSPLPQRRTTHLMNTQ